ncbi:hypothetical protein MNB_SM-7-455 [hydrothermal vent metagenome]|uniref:RDD domain-containing protein n=1 Tax=hydrothermal vent metagenome TaxID=652676 RepID=A0A1W1BTG8_9ZZZZ
MNSSPKYAGFFIRLIASFLDTLFLALPLGVVVYFLSGGEWFDFQTYWHNLQLAAAGDPQALSTQPKTDMRWELFFEFLVLLVTIVFWEKWGGTTPGKRMVGIKIVDAKTYKDITNKQAITRSLGYIPSTLLLGIGFLMVLFRKDRRALHDLLANTVVIYDETKE